MQDLRPYQQDCFESIKRDKNKHTLVEMCVGAGKTFMLGHITKHALECGHRVLILCHRAKLLRQTQAHIRKLGIEPSMFGNSLGDKSFGNVTIAQFQSLIRYEGDIKADLILVDECHTISSRHSHSYTKLLKRIEYKKLIGFTATPYRFESGLIYDTQDATKMFKDVAYRYTAKMATEDGYIVPLEFKRCEFYEDIEASMMKMKGADYDTAPMVLSLRKHKDVIALFIERTARNKNLYFFPSVEIAKEYEKELVYMYGREGVGLLTADTSLKARWRIDSNFQTGKMNHLLNVSVMTEGFDYPCIDNIYMFHATASLGRYVQELGRGCRLFEGKKECFVYDLFNNRSVLGTLTEPKLDSFLQGTMVECPNCKNKFSKKAFVTTEVLGVPVREFTCTKCSHKWQVTVKQSDEVVKRIKQANEYIFTNDPNVRIIERARAYYSTTKKKMFLHCFDVLNRNFKIVIGNPKYRWSTNTYEGRKDVYFLSNGFPRVAVFEGDRYDLSKSIEFCEKATANVKSIYEKVLD